ncbi:MAG: LysE family translocator [Acidiferrobacterales bacterium]
MESSLSPSAIAALFGVMATLALVPSVSVLTVSTRSATYGFIHGVFVTMGIAVVDIIFILIAILGLSVLAESMGSLFIIVKYLGSAYLIWLGITLWRSRLSDPQAGNNKESSLIASFMAGFFITLGDQKAILFYFGIFPAFFDLTALSYLDVVMVIVIMLVALVGTKLGYAYMADKTRNLFKNDKLRKKMNIAAGSIMIGAGIFLVARA